MELWAIAEKIIWETFGPGVVSSIELVEAEDWPLGCSPNPVQPLQPSQAFASESK
jgi:hypothetical protein